MACNPGSKDASPGSDCTVHASTSPSSPWVGAFTQSQVLLDGTKSIHVLLKAPANASEPLLVFHHGAGSSTLSFVPLVRQLQRLMPAAGFLAIDARGHGRSRSENTEPDFRLNTLSDDLAKAIELSLPHINLSIETCPSLWLIGHSLGGAVVCHLATEYDAPSWMKKAISAAVVLDVVEGSAIESLNGMRGLLTTRPDSFASLEDAIEWHLRTRALRNSESAKVSTEGMVHLRDGRWVWTAPLMSTEPFWSGWFTGLSKRFLSVKGGRLLVLAGTDRLDKELIIGQMQGKFQLEVIPDSGHFIQEDKPVELASIIATFVERNDRSKLVIPTRASFFGTDKA